ncbi:MAG: PTS sugar transporter subunit IIA [Candidatus Omnitrophica bacterium]|nr:PTS sugar transporter subunit IIA [Candidatus Omnitrophota bacterium]
MFQQLLLEESIGIGLKAENQKQALKQMVDLLPQWGLKESTKAELLERLLERERFGTTAIGDGIALPRCIFSGVQYPLAALAISREGIHYPSLDGELVHIIFLLVLPEREESQQHKERILHIAESFFRDRFLCERIKIAEHPEEVYELLLREGSPMYEMVDRDMTLRARYGT